jgi:hypothetical protein
MSQVVFAADGHTRQWVGFTLIHLLVSDAIHPPTTRRHGNATVCGPSFSMTANSRSPEYGAVAIGFQSMSVERSLFFALGQFSQDRAGGRVHMMDQLTYRTGHWLIDVAVLRSVFGTETLNP